MSSDCRAHAKAFAYLRVSVSSTREVLKQTMKELTSSHPSGYPIALLEDFLAKKYICQEEKLKTIFVSTSSKDTLLPFFAREHNLLRNEMIHMYNSAKDQYAQGQIDNVLMKIAHEGKFFCYTEDCLEGLASSVEAQVLRNSADGWLLPPSITTSHPDSILQRSVDEQFQAWFRSIIKQTIENFRRRCMKGGLDNALRRVAEDRLQEAMRSMESALEVTVQEMVHTRPAGYLMVQLEQTLNQEYHSLKKTLQAQLKLSPYATATLDGFDTDCASLRTRMIDRYNVAKKVALSLALRRAGHAIDACLENFNVGDLWRDMSAEECFENKLSACLQQLARDVEGSVLQKCATGWLLTAQGSPPLNTADPEVMAQVDREKTFLSKVHDTIHNACNAFSLHWHKEVVRRVEQAKAEETLRFDASWKFHPGENRKGKGGNDKRSARDQRNRTTAQTAHNHTQPSEALAASTADTSNEVPAKTQRVSTESDDPHATPAVESLKQQAQEAQQFADHGCHKWINSGEGKALVVHKVPSIFSQVAKNPCNLISIFGRARQGKSFLMNCLAGEREIFKISNEKESCTQGIDISSKWLSLADFSKLDGGKHIGGRTEGIRIGFVDAEGQGYKDVSYDANLMCPILFLSKCVIFNWKGDLQINQILSTLGIMARAAQNIATESAGAQKSKFGHLHIIFRDWQAVKTDEEAVFHALLGIENTTEGTTRDLIRADLLSSFESIKVWLFDPPSEYTRDLKNKLVYENTSSTFRTQVRALREALAQQLKEPTYLAGNVLTGRTYIPLTENIAEALNSGQVVLPSSAYLNMMRQEAQQLTRQYEAELKAQVTQLLQSFENKAGELFITRSESLSRFVATEKAVQGRFQARIADVVGNVAAAPGTPVAVILSEYAAQLQDIHTSSEAQFLALYNQQFSQWLLKVRKAAEKTIENELLLLEKSLPMADQELTQHLEAAYHLGLNLIGGTKSYDAICTEATDAEQVLRRYFESASAPLHETNARLNQSRRREAEDRLQEAMRSMEAALEVTVQEMVRTRPAGYLMVQLEQTLNQEYHSLKKTLQAQLKLSPYATATLVRFDSDCASLRTRMIDRYNAAKKAALSLALSQTGDAIDAYLKKFDVNDLWRDVPLEECEVKLSTCLKQLARDVEGSVLQKCATGWLLTAQGSPLNTADPEVVAQVDREKSFLAELHGTFYSACNSFGVYWHKELNRRIEQTEDVKEKIPSDAPRCFQPAATQACQKEMVEGKGTENKHSKHTSVSSMPTVAQSATGSALPRRRRVTCRKTHAPAGPPSSTEAAPTAVSQSSHPQANPQPSATRIAHVPSSKPKKKEKVISRERIVSKHSTTTRVHLSWPTNINESMEPELADLFPTERYVEHTQPSRSPSPAVLSPMENDFAMLSMVSEVFAVEFKSAVQSRENTPQKSQKTQNSPHSLEACLARSSALRGANLYNTLGASPAEEVLARKYLLEEIAEDATVGTSTSEEVGTINTPPEEEQAGRVDLRAGDCDLRAILSGRGVLRGLWGSQEVVSNRNRDLEEEIEGAVEERIDELEPIAHEEEMTAKMSELCEANIPNERTTDDVKESQESADEEITADKVTESNGLEELEECVESEVEDGQIEDIAVIATSSAEPEIVGVFVAGSVQGDGAEPTEELVAPNGKRFSFDGTSPLELSAYSKALAPLLLVETHLATSSCTENGVGKEESSTMCAVGVNSTATQSGDTDACEDIECISGAHAGGEARAQQTAADSDHKHIAPAFDHKPVQEDRTSSSLGGGGQIQRVQDTVPVLLGTVGPTELGTLSQNQQHQQPNMCDAATNTEQDDPSPSDVNTGPSSAQQRKKSSWFPKMPRLFGSGKK